MIINPNKDGIDHINVYSKGKTELGRLLSNFAHTPFVHPEDGYFKSVEGYWYWLGCKNDKLRNVYGYEAKQLGRELNAPDWIDTEEFKRKIKLALRSKLEQHPRILNKLKLCNLPLVHYYIYGDLLKRNYKIHIVERGIWILDELKNIKNE